MSWEEAVIGEAIVRGVELLGREIVAAIHGKRPDLRTAPRPDGEAAADERVRVELERRRLLVTEPDGVAEGGILADWPPKPKADE
jgi:hypothetical protein